MSRQNCVPFSGRIDSSLSFHAGVANSQDVFGEPDQEKFGLSDGKVVIAREEDANGRE